MPHQPVIFGEVLFDIFDNDQSVLGGAPFNVAWHLHGFGLNPVFVSRIGKDRYGEQILAAMTDWGMNTGGVQLDNEFSTGQVQVSLNKGQPSFDILEGVAYDHIDSDEAGQAMSDLSSSMFYHGSLVARTPPMYELVKSLASQAGTIFADINLRAPWWSRETILELISGIDVLKVNDDELASLMNTDISAAQLEQAALNMQAEYQLHKIIVTRGEHGAFSLLNDEITHAKPFQVDNLVDTVGAGDSFSAVCMLGELFKWPEQQTLARATEFAARICQQRGATNNDPALYIGYRQAWGIE